MDLAQRREELEKHKARQKEFLRKEMEEMSPREHAQLQADRDRANRRHLGRLFAVFGAEPTDNLVSGYEIGLCHLHFNDAYTAICLALEECTSLPKPVWLRQRVERYLLENIDKPRVCPDYNAAGVEGSALDQH